MDLDIDIDNSVFQKYAIHTMYTCVAPRKSILGFESEARMIASPRGSPVNSLLQRSTSAAVQGLRGLCFTNQIGQGEHRSRGVITRFNSGVSATEDQSMRPHVLLRDMHEPSALWLGRIELIMGPMFAGIVYISIC